MMMMEGWQEVEEFLRDRIADNRNRLMSCEMVDVVKHRAKVEAFESVFIHIKEVIEEGDREMRRSQPP